MMCDRPHRVMGMTNPSTDATPPLSGGAASGPFSDVHRSARAGWTPTIVRRVTIIEGDPTHRDRHNIHSQGIHPL
ncbi:hypothetical protein NSPZN2_10708 [Nitrospira defluvii]|uniref:Uncharacterized protein n=1 Tax=Nitrospira defluvii TaxID=330214 RepID=A0ABM8QK69_9BACT|nr:hypothetical protein NSPZN2_10708 [Nitrospira defluvii]